jgi:chorismate synthase
MSFNTFGHLFRFTSFGESHGAAIGCVVDGCPPRIPLTEADIQVHLDKRRPGQSRFTTQRQEPDTVKILSGVFTGADGVQVTTGTPIMLMIENVDQRSKDYSDIKDKYRPGHAGYVYDVKYGITDYRGGGRSSARDRGAGGGRCGGAQDCARRHRSRRSCADGPAQNRPHPLGLERGR